MAEFPMRQLKIRAEILPAKFQLPYYVLWFNKSKPIYLDEKYVSFVNRIF